MGFIALIIEFFEISIHEVLAPESCTIPCVIAMLHDIRDNPGHAVGDSSFPIILGCHHLVTNRSEEHPSALQSLMRTSSAVFCFIINHTNTHTHHNAQAN